MNVEFFKTLCENTLPTLGFHLEDDSLWEKEEGITLFVVWVDENSICFERQSYILSENTHFELDECPTETIGEIDEVTQIEFSSVDEFRNFRPELADEERVEEIIRHL